MLKMSLMLPVFLTVIPAAISASPLTYSDIRAVSGSGPLDALRNPALMAALPEGDRAGMNLSFSPARINYRQSYEPFIEAEFPDLTMSVRGSQDEKVMNDGSFSGTVGYAHTGSLLSAGFALKQDISSSSFRDILNIDQSVVYADALNRSLRGKSESYSITASPALSIKTAAGITAGLSVIYTAGFDELYRSEHTNIGQSGSLREDSLHSVSALAGLSLKLGRHEAGLTFNSGEYSFSKSSYSGNFTDRTGVSQSLEVSDSFNGSFVGNPGVTAAYMISFSGGTSAAIQASFFSGFDREESDLRLLSEAYTEVRQKTENSLSAPVSLAAEFTVSRGLLLGFCASFSFTRVKTTGEYNYASTWRYSLTDDTVLKGAASAGLSFVLQGGSEFTLLMSADIIDTRSEISAQETAALDYTNYSSITDTSARYISTGFTLQAAYTAPF